MTPLQDHNGAERPESGVTCPGPANLTIKFGRGG
jgi:hypothetical protein